MFFCQYSLQFEKSVVVAHLKTAAATITNSPVLCSYASNTCRTRLHPNLFIFKFILKFSSASFQTTRCQLDFNTKEAQHVKLNTTPKLGKVEGFALCVCVCVCVFVCGYRCSSTSSHSAAVLRRWQVLSSAQLTCCIRSFCLWIYDIMMILWRVFTMLYWSRMTSNSDDTAVFFSSFDPLADIHGVRALHLTDSLSRSHSFFLCESPQTT